MNFVRFIFGHGWWIVWHICFYLILLLTVGLALLMFGQDLKRPGQKPDLPSPASIMVLLIAIGLGFVTLVDLLIFARVVAMPGWVKAVAAILIAAAVVGGMTPLNMLLAERQSVYFFWCNVALSGIVILANLGILWMSETRAPASVPAGNALLAVGGLLIPSLSAVTIALVKRPTI
jgi:hypothetical protein